MCIVPKIDPTLTSLKLPHKSIGSAGAIFLAEALKNNTTLTELDLSNNSIGDEGVAALAEALYTNKTLTKLCVKGLLREDSKTILRDSVMDREMELTI